MERRLLAVWFVQETAGSRLSINRQPRPARKPGRHADKKGGFARELGDFATLLSRFSTLHGLHATLQSRFSTLHGLHATLQSHFSTLHGLHATLQNAFSTLHGACENGQNGLERPLSRSFASNEAISPGFPPVPNRTRNCGADSPTAAAHGFRRIQDQRRKESLQRHVPRVQTFFQRKHFLLARNLVFV